MKTTPLRKFIFFISLFAGFVFISFYLFGQSVIMIENHNNNSIFKQLRDNSYSAKCSTNCISLFIPQDVKTCGINDSRITSVIIVPASQDIVFYSAVQKDGKNMVDFTLANNNPDSILKSDWTLSTQPVIIDMYNKTFVSSEAFISHANKKYLVHDLNYIISSFCSNLKNND